VENQTGDLELMLAEIYSDNPPTNTGDTQSKALHIQLTDLN